MASNSRIIVAAIDIGTTFSGYAFSFMHEKDVITTNKIWVDGKAGRASYKTPTVVLVDQRGKFNCFGYEAEDKYAQLSTRNQHTDWSYFRRFKMSLYNKENLSRSLTISSVGGKKLKAMAVFAMAIRYLKDHLMGVVGDEIEESDVQFVLTVPAIWGESAKQFMRETAKMADIKGDHLTVSLEPESASIYCRSLSSVALTGNVGTHLDISSPGARYMVLDAGGGTIDITIHEVDPDNKLKELNRATGGNWGGTRVDEEFLRFLKKLFTTELIEAFGKKHPADLLEVEREFEIQKRKVSSKKIEDITVCIPSSLTEMLAEPGAQIAKAGFGKKVRLLGDKLRMSSDVLTSLFTPTCEEITIHVRRLLQFPRCLNVKTILMVGGFSESPMLQEMMNDVFPAHQIIIPKDATLAVLKGAVMFGHTPGAIQVRLSKYTYGIRTLSTFVEGKHDLCHYELVEGEQKCKDIFDRFVYMNEETFQGKTSREMSYCPVYTGQTSMDLKVFRSTTVSPMYTTEPSCSYIGKLNVPMPDLTGEKKRRIRVQVVFGGTEMTVKAHEVTTDKDYEATFNFLCE